MKWIDEDTPMLIDANSLIESLLDCPDDEEVGLKNAKEPSTASLI